MIPKAKIDKNSKTLLVITPAYQEEDSIENVIQEVKEIEISNVEITHLIIDDGSTDNTAEKARQAGADVLQHPVNLGYGATIQTGFKYAVRHNFDYTLQIDADGQHDSKDALNVLHPVLEGEADFSVGSRMLGDPGYDIPFVKRLGIKFYAKVLSFLLDTKVTDSTSGYRATHRKVFSEFAQYYPQKLCAVETELLVGKRGYSIQEVPVTMHPRKNGATYLDFWTLLLYPLKMVVAILRALSFSTSKAFSTLFTWKKKGNPSKKLEAEVYEPIRQK